MQAVRRAQVVEALQALGIQPGDGLLTHSAIQFLGAPEGGAGMYLEALAEVLALDLQAEAPVSGGTLCVPTFNFAFAKGEAYDPQTTVSVGMGTFSELVRRHPAAKRTLHPMQSIAALGRWRDDLVRRDTPSAFDPGSAFERMLELDFSLLLLGANLQAASILHYSEIRAAVPYRYWKDFSGTVILDGIPQERTCRMFVRDLELDARLETRPIETLLRQRGQWHAQALNYGLISACRLRDFVRAADEILAQDPWALVTNRPDGKLR